MTYWKLLGFSALTVAATRATAQTGTPSSCPAMVPHSSGVAATDRHAWGASVALIDSATIASLGGRSLSEVLTARLAGVSVMRSSGIAGTGSRIRLRGPSGIVLPQQPLLYINGVRVESEAQSIGLEGGGQAPSRIDDVPVEDVRCLFVLRGPAATAAYGTDAAGGVIHVVTRGSRDGGQRAQAFIEGGASVDATDYPANFGTCSRAAAALGTCAGGTVRSWSPLDADSPFRTAPLIRAGARAMAFSTERVSLGVSATGTVDNGPLITNDHTRFTAAGTSSFRNDSSFEAHADAWLMGGRTDLPLIGAPSNSILNSALLGSSVDDPLRRGYRRLPLSVLELFGTTQRLRRLGGVARVTWMPTRAVAVGAVVSREDSRVRDEQTPPSVRITATGYELLPEEFVSQSEIRSQRTTANASAKVSYGPSAFRLATYAAIELRDDTHRQSQRVFDRSNVSGPQSSSWMARDASMTDFIVRQSVVSNDRRFLDVGIVRAVSNREFPTLEKPTYPFASVAWDLAREVGLSPTGFVSSLRIRAAYGESGDMRPYRAASTFTVVVPSPTEPERTEKLPVERTREIEGGLDIGVLGAVDLRATWFRKRTTDALLERPLPPAAGNPGATAVEPGAAWRTHGTEIALGARVIDRQSLSARLALTFSSYDNEVDALGQRPSIVGTTYRMEVGYPLFGAWARPFTATDVNGDGVIVPAEVVAATESRFLGSPVPTREIGFAPSITIARAVTIAALVDYRGGHRIYNVGGRLRCNGVCEALYDPNASFADQARAVDPNDALIGWIEDGSFTKLRELSLTWALPSSWTRRLGARSSTASILGRNLWTATDYSGLDPEVSYPGQSSTLQEELFVPPPPRTVSLRFEARW